jgi:ribosomal protein L12E/L44/L45/RPP1/RPP2
MVTPAGIRSGAGVVVVVFDDVVDVELEPVVATNGTFPAATAAASAPAQARPTAQRKARPTRLTIPV